MELSRLLQVKSEEDKYWMISPTCGHIEKQNIGADRGKSKPTLDTGLQRLPKAWREVGEQQEEEIHGLWWWTEVSQWRVIHSQREFLLVTLVPRSPSTHNFRPKAGLPKVKSTQSQILAQTHTSGQWIASTWTSNCSAMDCQQSINQGLHSNFPAFCNMTKMLTLGTWHQYLAAGWGICTLSLSLSRWCLFLITSMVPGPSLTFVASRKLAPLT